MNSFKQANTLILEESCGRKKNVPEWYAVNVLLENLKTFSQKKAVWKNNNIYDYVCVTTAPLLFATGDI